MTEFELYQKPFSIKRHKSMPYHVPIELIISPSGKIEYANPSHQENLIEKAMKRNNWTRQELIDACPKEFYLDFLKWLIIQSGGYIPVWEMGVDCTDSITIQQILALKRLKAAKLYCGEIPNI